MARQNRGSASGWRVRIVQATVRHLDPTVPVSLPRRAVRDHRDAHARSRAGDLHGNCAVRGGAHLVTASSPLSEDDFQAITAQRGVMPIRVAVAPDAIVLVVNHENPLAGLTLQQVAEIFGAPATRRSSNPALVVFQCARNRCGRSAHRRLPPVVSALPRAGRCDAGRRASYISTGRGPPPRNLDQLQLTHLSIGRIDSVAESRLVMDSTTPPQRVKAPSRWRCSKEERLNETTARLFLGCAIDELLGIGFPELDAVRHQIGLGR